MMMERRQWLKKIGIAGATSMMLPQAIAGYSSSQVKSFNARPFETPVRLSSNENPYGPSERVRAAMTKGYDIECRKHKSYSNELFEMIA